LTAHPIPAVEALGHRLAEVLCAAQRRARQARGFAAYVTPAIPDRVIDESAHGIAPVMRDLSLVSAREVLAEGLREAVDGLDTPVAVLLRQLVAEVVRPPEPNATAWTKHLANVTRPSLTTDLRGGAA
jgi:hypothetical protein